MQAGPVTRRNFLNRSAILVTPALLAGIAAPLGAAEANPARNLKVVCIGGHPDDPESGCAGTLARYSELGHSVTVIYLT
ncbi:MAG TPA: PIG-L family deacetylase, partial [Verrucomicrobiae bacterium]|nr:PIG-L family deacetylase [Verrucomicrobiae bacterium]